LCTPGKITIGRLCGPESHRLSRKGQRKTTIKEKTNRKNKKIRKQRHKAENPKHRYKYKKGISAKIAELEGEKESS
jgi:hypothetical protein